MPNGPMQNLHDLYVEELKDLYSAETQILQALPMMAAVCTSEELRAGFEQHLRETEEQVRRLERVMKRLGESLEEVEECKGMKGLLEEGQEMMKAKADMDVLDAALISAAQRVEHYEMAGYGTVRTYAEMLGYSQDAEILQQTLDEEGATDRKLSMMAESVINVRAAK